MRKVDPADVIDDFKAQLNSLENYFLRVSAALKGTSHEKSDISLLAEQAFVTAAVALEGFFSDLVVGFVNRDSATLVADLRTRFTQSTEEKFGNCVQGYVTLNIPAHPKVQQIRRVLDRDERNVTFRSARDMKGRVGNWLIPAHAAKFTALSVHEERVIDTIRSIRDYIVHRSSASKNKMNEELLRIGGAGTPNGLLGRDQRKVTDVGAFLKTIVHQPEHRRIQKYLARVRAIADALR